MAQACYFAAINRKQGLYHVSGKEEDLDSIYSLAHSVADYFKLDASLINAVTTPELNQKAIRPAKTGFILDKARNELEYKPHSFLDGLKIVSDQLLEKT